VRCRYKPVVCARLWPGASCGARPEHVRPLPALTPCTTLPTACMYVSCRAHPPHCMHVRSMPCHPPRSMPCTTLPTACMCMYVSCRATLHVPCRGPSSPLHSCTISHCSGACITVCWRRYNGVDSCGASCRAAQLEWLEKDLAAANANRDAVPWIVAFSHFPLYCARRARHADPNGKPSTLRWQASRPQCQASTPQCQGLQC
jgi:hypothetical protein